MKETIIVTEAGQDVLRKVETTEEEGRGRQDGGTGGEQMKREKERADIERKIDDGKGERERDREREKERRREMTRLHETTPTKLTTRVPVVPLPRRHQNW